MSLERRQVDRHRRCPGHHRNTHFYRSIDLSQQTLRGLLSENRYGTQPQSDVLYLRETLSTRGAGLCYDTQYQRHCDLGHQTVRQQFGHCFGHSTDPEVVDHSETTRATDGFIHLMKHVLIEMPYESYKRDPRRELDEL